MENGVSRALTMAFTIRLWYEVSIVLLFFRYETFYHSWLMSRMLSILSRKVSVWYHVSCCNHSPTILCKLED